MRVYPCPAYPDLTAPLHQTPSKTNTCKHTNQPLAFPATAPGGGASAKVSYVLAGERRWANALPAHVTAMAGSPTFAAVATADATLLLYTLGGRRGLPPIELAAPVSMMAAAGGNGLMVLTADGKLAVWDVAKVCAYVCLCVRWVCGGECCLRAP